MGDMAGAGDFPALMAATLYSTDGYKAAPEVADLLKQSREINAKQGADMRAQLSELLTPKDMARIDDAAGVPKDERTAPRSEDASTASSPKGIGDEPARPKDDGKVEVAANEQHDFTPAELSPAVEAQQKKIQDILAEQRRVFEEQRLNRREDGSGPKDPALAKELERRRHELLDLERDARGRLMELIRDANHPFRGIPAR